MDKLAVIDAVIKTLKEEMELAVHASREAYEAATDEDAYSDGKYDTRSLEASYLAGGQAQIAKDLGNALQGYSLLRAQHFIQPPSRQVGMGSLLKISDGREPCWYLVGPGGGGLEVEAEGARITVLTLHSPLGLALASRREGETVKLPKGPLSIESVL